jgi:hypothetical protein
MKHSSTWIALILIASALLLSAERINAQSPNPRNPQNEVGQAQPSETNTEQQEGEPASATAIKIPAASHQEISSQENQQHPDCYLQKAWGWVVSIWTVEYTGTGLFSALSLSEERVRERCYARSGTSVWLGDVSMQAAL